MVTVEVKISDKARLTSNKFVTVLTDTLETNVTNISPFAAKPMTDSTVLANTIQVVNATDNDELFCCAVLFILSSRMIPCILFYIVKMVLLYQHTLRSATFAII